MGILNTHTFTHTHSRTHTHTHTQAIVFSQFVSMLDLIEYRLKLGGIQV